MYKYIKNPINNKKVNIHSKLGKNILKQYLNLLIGGKEIPPPPSLPGFSFKRNNHLPHRYADLYDLHKDQQEIEKRLHKFTFNKRLGDHDCIGTDYDEEENCLVDPVMGECIKKDDILQYTAGQCDSKERACGALRRYGYNKNPITRAEEDANFWQTNCPPPPILFGQLDDVTIRVAVDRYRNDTASCPLIETWDVSRVTDMNSLFKDFEDFNGNITHWNTSRVTNMSNIFSETDSFNQPLEWDTGNVTDMNGMFNDATSLDQPLKFNIRNDTQTDWMFVGSSGRLDDSEAYPMSLANILIG